MIVELLSLNTKDVLELLNIFSCRRFKFKVVYFYSKLAILFYKTCKPTIIINFWII
jgi:hypothetical protein